MLDSVHFSARFLSKLIVVVVEAFTMTKNTEICPERRSLNILVLVVPATLSKIIDKMFMSSSSILCFLTDPFHHIRRSRRKDSFA